MSKYKQHLLAASAALLASSTLTHAAATRVAYMDAFATARGNAFTATADNPSAVFYNAAGLTQQEGTNFLAGVYLPSLDYEFEGSAGTESVDDEYQPIPTFFMSHRFKDSPIAVGFGAYAPFAVGTDWGSDASFTAPPFGLATPYEGELTYIKYHAVIAWQISDTLSIAAGVSYDDADVDIKTAALEFDGDDTTYGYSASIRWTPHEQHAFGLNYQGKTDVTFDGDLDVLFPAPGSVGAEADLIFPESIVFGYSYRPNEKWNIEFNVDWTNWDRVDELELETEVPLPFPTTYALNWESAFIWELGATRYFEGGWHLSAGYTFVENAIPDEEFLPIVPDADRHIFGIGVGRNYEHIYWQFTYQYTYAEARSVTGAIVDGPAELVDGDYDMDAHGFALSLGYRF